MDGNARALLHLEGPTDEVERVMEAMHGAASRILEQLHAEASKPEQPCRGCGS